MDEVTYRQRAWSSSPTKEGDRVSLAKEEAEHLQGLDKIIEQP